MHLECVQQGRTLAYADTTRTCVCVCVSFCVYLCVYASVMQTSSLYYGHAFLPTGPELHLPCKATLEALTTAAPSQFVVETLTTCFIIS